MEEEEEEKKEEEVVENEEEEEEEEEGKKEEKVSDSFLLIIPSHLLHEDAVAFPQPPVLRRQLVGNPLKPGDVLLQFLGVVPSHLNPLTPHTATLDLRVLDGVIECPCSIQHHWLLTGDHLLVDGVIEVGNLFQDDGMAVELLGCCCCVLNLGWNGEPDG